MKSFYDFDAIYLHRDAVDFRKSINGLSVIVEQAMLLSPFDSALFVFCNKQHDKLKILYWDKTGFCLWYKRLEHDRFKWPRKAPEATINLSSEQFDWLLHGINIEHIKPHSFRIYSSV